MSYKFDLRVRWSKQKKHKVTTQQRSQFSFSNLQQKAQKRHPNDIIIYVLKENQKFVLKSQSHVQILLETLDEKKGEKKLQLIAYTYQEYNEKKLEKSNQKQKIQVGNNHFNQASQVQKIQIKPQKLKDIDEEQKDRFRDRVEGQNIKKKKQQRSDKKKDNPKKVNDKDHKDHKEYKGQKSHKKQQSSKELGQKPEEVRKINKKNKKQQQQSSSKPLPPTQNNRSKPRIRNKQQNNQNKTEPPPQNTQKSNIKDSSKIKQKQKQKQPLKKSELLSQSQCGKSKVSNYDNFPSKIGSKVQNPQSFIIKQKQVQQQQEQKSQSDIRQQNQQLKKQQENDLPASSPPSPISQKKNIYCHYCMKKIDDYPVYRCYQCLIEKWLCHKCQQQSKNVQCIDQHHPTIKMKSQKQIKKIGKISQNKQNIYTPSSQIKQQRGDPSPKIRCKKQEFQPGLSSQRLGPQSKLDQQLMGRSIKSKEQNWQNYAPNFKEFNKHWQDQLIVVQITDRLRRQQWVIRPNIKDKQGINPSYQSLQKSYSENSKSKNYICDPDIQYKKMKKERKNENERSERIVQVQLKDQQQNQKKEEDKQNQKQKDKDKQMQKKDKDKLKQKNKNKQKQKDKQKQSSKQKQKHKQRQKDKQKEQIPKQSQKKLPKHKINTKRTRLKHLLPNIPQTQLQQYFQGQYQYLTYFDLFNYFQQHNMYTKYLKKQ